jgi:hypothetical protein
LKKNQLKKEKKTWVNLANQQNSQPGSLDHDNPIKNKSKNNYDYDYEVKLLINSILKDEFEEKNIIKKEKRKKWPESIRLTCKTRDLRHETMIIPYK